MAIVNPTYGTFTSTLPIRIDTFSVANEFNFSMKIQELYDIELKIRALHEHIKSLEQTAYTIKCTLPKQIVELYDQQLVYEALKE